MKKIILSIGGMSCSACSNGLEKYLNKQKGIHSANVNLVLAQASIEYEDNLTLDDLARYVEEAGFECLGEFKTIKEEKISKMPILIYAILVIIFMYVAMYHMIGAPMISLFQMDKNPKNYAGLLFLLTIPFLWYGRDILKSGFKNFIHRTPNMDSLILLGVIFSFGFSCYHMVLIFMGQPVHQNPLYFESVAMILYFMKLGRFIDNKSKAKTKKAIQELVQITPTMALIKKDGKEMEVTIDEVRKGDILIAKPGMKVAVDGIIVQGESHFEESFITGESVPVKKTINDEVIAGSMNVDGYIEYEARRIGKDSTISEIVRLVVEATNEKPPIGRLADKVSGYFVPFIVVVAFLTFLGTLGITKNLQESILSMVTVLVVACPCALGLATPLAMVVSVGECAKRGILMKSSALLEKAYQTDTIVFDKTGTLTYGTLKIAKCYLKDGVDKEDVLSSLCSMESKSTHPISFAFKLYQQELSLSNKEVSHFQNLPGLGLKGIVQDEEYYVGNEKILEQLSLDNPFPDESEKLVSTGHTILYVIRNQKVIGIIGLKDMVREEVSRTIKQLQKMGKEIVMLTGDHEKVAHLVGDSLGIRNVIANVMPKEKTEVIRKLMADGKNVMMVGDGINDAPSLALATIGVSIHSGTDIANDSADIILMNDQIEKIPILFRISEKTIWNIRENLFWAFFYNVLMIPIAIGILKPWGITINPMIASLAMTISSLTVVLNALRLKNVK